MGAWLAAIVLAGWLLPAVSAGADAEPYVWRNVTIVAGGFVPGIIFSPKQPGLVYCRTDIGVAYRWDAVAKCWIPLTDWVGPADSNLMGCESIAPDPLDANKVYLAVGMYSRGPAAILRSTDQGKTFQITRVPFSMGGNENGRGVGERLAIDPHDTSILYFGSRHDGLWVSTDGAVTWKKVDSFPVKGSGSTGDTGLSFVVFDPRGGSAGTPTSTIYVGVAEPGDANLYRSTDAGKTWQAVAGQPAGLFPHQGAVDANGVLFLTYGNGVGPNGVTSGAVWKFNPDSSQWTNITPPDSKTAGGFSGLSLDRQHPGTLAVSTLDHWSPTDDIYRSTDTGTTWKAVAAASRRDATLSPYLFWGRAQPRFGWWITALAIDPFDTNHVLYGTGATIWGTMDFADASADKPTQWFVAAKGMEETAVLDLISPPAGPHLISGLGDIGGFRHDDLNVSPASGMFNTPMFTNTNALDFAELNPSVVVRTGSGNGATAAFSEDGGATWQPLNLGAGAPAAGRGRGGNAGAGSLIVSADGKTFLSTRGASSISTDHGQTWVPCAGLPGGLRPVADRANAKKFYALDQANGKIYISADGGVTFTAHDSAGLPAAGGGRGGAGNRARLRAVPGHEGDLWLTAGRALYHSTDGGTTFTRVSPSANISTLGFGMAAPGRNYPALYLAGAVDGVQGVFRSDDVGATWVRINDDLHQYGYLPTVVIGDPRIYGRVYTGTNGRGIFYADPAAAAAH